LKFGSQLDIYLFCKSVDWVCRGQNEVLVVGILSV